MTQWYGWKREERGSESRWTWHGQEKELLDSIQPNLLAAGYHLLREVQLAARTGRVDLVGWSDEELLVIEAKHPPYDRGGTYQYKSVAAGLGQLLVYRESIERQRSGWHLGVDPDIVRFGGPVWNRAPEKVRCALLLGCPDRRPYEIIEATARRAGLEVWYWLPPGNLVQLSPLMGT